MIPYVPEKFFSRYHAMTLLDQVNDQLEDTRFEADG